MSVGARSELCFSATPARTARESLDAAVPRTGARIAPVPAESRRTGYAVSQHDAGEPVHHRSPGAGAAHAIDACCNECEERRMTTADRLHEVHGSRCPSRHRSHRAADYRSGRRRPRQDDRARGTRALFTDGRCVAGSILGLDVTGEDVEDDGTRLVGRRRRPNLPPRPGHTHPHRGCRRPGAQVLMTMYDTDGTPTYADPRHVLARRIEALAPDCDRSSRRRLSSTCCPAMPDGH